MGAFLVKVRFQSLVTLGEFFKKGLLGAFLENFTKFNQQKLHDMQNCHFYLDIVP
jgi:hypothetical protein